MKIAGRVLIVIVGWLCLPLAAWSSEHSSEAPSMSAAEALQRLELGEARFVSGHPATSVPTGLARGLPAGLMIVGRHFDDAACLRTARAFEAAVGGFPSPPAP